MDRWSVPNLCFALNYFLTIETPISTESAVKSLSDFFLLSKEIFHTDSFGLEGN